MSLSLSLRTCFKIDAFAYNSENHVAAVAVVFGFRLLLLLGLFLVCKDHTMETLTSYHGTL